MDTPQNTEQPREQSPQPDELVLELSFVPAWARKPPEMRSAPESTHGGAREERAFQRDASGPRRPRRDDRRSGGGSAGGPRGGRRDAAPDRRRGEPRPPPPPALPPVNVHFLPEQKNLALITRKVSSSHRAFPLAEIAHLFLSNPEACVVKIEPAPSAPDLRFFLCRTCRAASLSEAALLAHCVTAHFADYFSVEETLGEPPSGQFTCIARCSRSGILLGPPNHHSYAERVQEVYRSRFSSMPFERFREGIETVRDEALIAQWKEERRKQTLYRLKQPTAGMEDALSRAAAEGHFRQAIAPTLVEHARRAVMTLQVARQLDDSALRAAVLDALTRETRFPLSLLFALRAAFRHMHLHVFKAGSGKGITFVTSTVPVPLDASHAVPAIRDVLTHLREHPGCTLKDVLDVLRPGEAPDAPACREIAGHLNWLVEKGHVIEFFNGTLSVPLGRQPAPSAP